MIRLRRSVLYVPADKTRALEKAIGLAADVVIIDLEDAVAPDRKDAAREAAVAAAGPIAASGKEVVIRINAIDTPWYNGDLTEVRRAGISALVLPKVKTAMDVKRVALRSGLCVWPMLETPQAILEAKTIAEAAALTGPAALILGTNDLCAEVGFAEVPGRETLSLTLQLVALAASAAGVDAIDGVCNALDDRPRLRGEAEQAQRLGYTGKTVIHPAQIGQVNRVFSPQPAAIAAAEQVVAAMREAERAGATVATLDGRMVESLHARAAERVLAMAAAVAARPWVDDGFGAPGEGEGERDASPAAAPEEAAAAARAEPPAQSDDAEPAVVAGLAGDDDAPPGEPSGADDAAATLEPTLALNAEMAAEAEAEVAAEPDPVAAPPPQAEPDAERDIVAAPDTPTPRPEPSADGPATPSVIVLGPPVETVARDEDPGPAAAESEPGHTEAQPADAPMPEADPVASFAGPDRVAKGGADAVMLDDVAPGGMASSEMSGDDMRLDNKAGDHAQPSSPEPQTGQQPPEPSASTAEPASADAEEAPDTSSLPENTDIPAKADAPPAHSETADSEALSNEALGSEDLGSEGLDSEDPNSEALDNGAADSKPESETARSESSDDTVSDPDTEAFESLFGREMEELLADRTGSDEADEDDPDWVAEPRKGDEDETR